MPRSAIVDPPSGTPTALFAAENENTPPASGDCVVKLKIPFVGSKPAGPVIVPAPEIARKLESWKEMVDEARLNVKPPTLQSAGKAVLGSNVQGAVIVTAVPTAIPMKLPVRL